MNDEFTSILESVVDCIKDQTFPFQQLLAISEQLRAMSGHSLTDVTLSTLMYEVHFCRACLDLEQTKSKCPQIGNQGRFIYVRTAAIFTAS